MKKMFSLIIGLLLPFSLFVNVIATEINIARSKISSDVFDSFSKTDGSALVYVELEDVDHSAVMKVFSERYPEEYAAYMKAKTKVNYERTTEEENEMLQKALECKREIYKEFYLLSNNEILGSVYRETEQVFVSHYAPLAIVETTQKNAIKLAKQDHVLAISEYVEKDAIIDYIYFEENVQSGWISEAFIADLVLANQINRSDILRNEYDLTGEGIKIGMIEADGFPDVTNQYLCSANITLDPYYTTGDSGFGATHHATQVATILVGSDDEDVYGVVPDAQLYCTIGQTMYHYYYSIEWLIECGVRIINSSMGFYTTVGLYDDCSAWVDHIAAVHDVHFVKSAGNYNENNSIMLQILTCNIK